MTLEATDWFAAGAIISIMHVTLVAVAVRQLLRQIRVRQLRQAWLVLIMLAPVIGTLCWFQFGSARTLRAGRQPGRKPLAF